MNSGRRQSEGAGPEGSGHDFDNLSLTVKSPKRPALFSTPALHLAAELETNDIAELLIASGADMEAKDKYGDTPLHHATAYFGRKSMAELLLANGADVSSKNNGGSTPLHGAAIYGKKDIVNLLIAKGADLDAEDGNGHTALYYAENPSDQKSPEEMADYKAMVKALTAHGAHLQ